MYELPGTKWWDNASLIYSICKNYLLYLKPMPLGWAITSGEYQQMLKNIESLEK